MAKRTGNKQPATDPALKKEVSEAAAKAEDNASEGNVATVKQTGNQPAEDLPTNARSHLS